MPNCIICNRPMGPADIDAQRAIIMTGPVEDCWLCVEHVSVDGKTQAKDYEKNVRKVAAEYAHRNRMLPVTRN